jgi:hypothetical protein
MRREIEQVTIAEFHALLKAQGVSAQEHLAFKCPMCATVQSAADLIRAGAGASFEDVEKYIAYSCVGRFTGAGSPRNKPDGKPCNWTLGGFFTLHKFEVIDDAGEINPRFKPATPAEAQAHEMLVAAGDA